MTFVIAISKEESREALGTSFSEMGTVATVYENITGPEYAGELEVVAIREHPQVTMVLDTKRSASVSHFARNKTVWSVSAGSNVAGELLESLARRAGHLHFISPVWGAYAAVYAEPLSGRVTAWNTLPTVESVCFAETRTHFIVGNRPLLVALAAARGAITAVTLDQEYLVEYLLYGYSMSGRLPYTGVRALPADTAVVFQRDQTEIVSTPSGLNSSLGLRPTTDESAEALADSLQNAASRIEQRLAERSIQMRLSGGKDSRMLLGLMRSTNVSVYGRVFGAYEDDDVALARYLANQADVELEVAAAPLAPGETIRERTERVLRQTDGIPLSEAHAAVYAGASPRARDDGIMLGQWPLAKGGAARKMNYSGEAVERVINQQAATFVRGSYRGAMEAFFDDWLKSVKSQSNLETLYLFSRNFRSTRWMQALLCMYSRDSHPVYPLADMEVTAVSDAIHMGDKVAQSAYFKALERIWPLATTIPFGKSGWPFDVRGKAHSIAPNTYEARTAEVASLGTEWIKGTERIVRPEFDSLSGIAGTEIAVAIQTSENFGFFKDILESDFIECVQDWAEGKRRAYAGYTWRTTLSSLWRVYLADVWFSRSWLEGASVNGV